MNSKLYRDRQKKVGLISLSKRETKITPLSENLCFRWISVDPKYLFISKIKPGYS